MLGGTNRTNAGVVAVVCLLCLAPVAGAAGVGDAAATASEAQATGTVTVTNYSVPSTVTFHRNFTVDVTVNNTGSSEVEKTIRVERARDRLWSTIATHNVTVPANTEKNVSFNATIHEGAPGDEQESVEDTLLRVAGQNGTAVEVEASNVLLDPGHHEWGWIRDQQLNQGETTTVSARLLNGFEPVEYEFRLRGGVYDAGRTFHRTLSIPAGEGESIEASPRFDAGGVHAVRANGRFLGFVNVSSPNVSVTSVESLPSTVYEGAEETLNVTVENTGGGTETFAVTTSHTPDGQTSPSRADTRVVTLTPGETRTVQRTVAFHERGQQTVAVNNGSGQTVTVEDPVAMQGYAIPETDHYSHQYVTLTATVTNRRATQATKQVEFSLWRGSGRRLDAALNETKTVTVPGGATKTVTYRAFVRRAGTYNATVGDGAVTTVEVAANPVAVTDLAAPAGTVAAGSQATLTVTLENTGSVDTNRHVGLSGPTDRYGRNVSVPAGETSTVTFSPTVTYRGPLEFAVGGAPGSRLRATVTVPAPNLTFGSLYAPANSSVRDDPVIRHPSTNTGNTTETYVVRRVVTHDEYPELVLRQNLTLPLDANDTDHTIWFTEVPQPGNYTVTANGEVVGSFHVGQPLEFVNGSLSNDTVRVGERVWFNGTFRNPTDTVELVPVTVPGTGVHDEVPVYANRTKNVSRYVTFPEAGNYTVLVAGTPYGVTVEANDTSTDPPTDDGDSGGDGSGSTGDTGGSSGGGGDSSTGGQSGGGSDSGDSSDSESSDDAATNGTDTGTDVVTVNATTAANGTAVAEASGSANQTVAIVVAGSNATDDNGTAVTSVNVSLAENETFTVSVSSSDAPPASLADDGAADPAGSVVEYVNISHPDLADDAIASASFTVTIGTERLAAMDAAPGDVVAYRYDDGWERVETTYRGRRGDAHAFEVDAPGLSVFAVGVADDPDESGTTEQSTTARSTTPQSTTEDAPQSTTEAPEGTTTGASGGTIPGFGVGAALVAVLGALLAAVWTRRD